MNGRTAPMHHAQIGEDSAQAQRCGDGGDHTGERPYRSEQHHKPHLPDYVQMHPTQTPQMSAPPPACA